MRKIIIFGAGEGGRHAIEHYRSCDDISILCVVDNSKQKQGTELEGIRVIPPSEILLQSYDVIVVASMYHQEIISQLIHKLSVPVDRIKIISTIIQKGNVDLRDTSRRALAREMMMAVCGELHRCGVPYHIDHGTLLGIYRDGDLLPWDIDVDLAIHASDMDAALAVLKPLSRSFRSELCQHNAWECVGQPGNICFGTQHQKLIRVLEFKNTRQCNVSRKLTLDLLVKYPLNGSLYWLAAATTLRSEARYFAERTTLNYRGTSLAIPADTETYLSNLYGDWRLKRKDWNHALYENIENTAPSLSFQE